MTPLQSAHKTFNRQSNHIGRGNVVSNTQVSSFIRSYHTTDTGFGTRERGDLQEFDLRWWINRFPGLYPLLEKVKKYTRDRGGILYLFRHHRGKDVILDGLVLTSRDHKLIKKWYLNNDWRARDAVDKAAAVVADEDPRFINLFNVTCEVVDHSPPPRWFADHVEEMRQQDPGRSEDEIEQMVIAVWWGEYSSEERATAREAEALQDI